MSDIVRTVADLRAALAPARRAGTRIGFVPTMGALHDGHLSLIRQAAAVSDVVVVSVFVNPTQFSEASDLEKYPRTVERDADLASSAGATLVFAPDADEVYPPGFSSSIRIAGVTEPWEGASRGASHFDGVALVVSKLLNMVGADTAWFGAKDAQQVAVVRRLVADFDLPVEIRVGETVRDADGLALSSRNARLSAADRPAALSLSRSLREAAASVADGETDVASLTARAHETLRAAGAEAEYWAIVDPVTFGPLVSVDDADALAIVAARVGDVRLIDNLPIPGRPLSADDARPAG